MSTLISCATGNWLDASTWKLVSTLSGAELDTELNNGALSTSYAYSGSFTTSGTLEVDGVVVRVYSRAASPSGTMTVCIGQGGSPVTGTEVTIDVADLPYTGAYPGSGVSNSFYGWYLFKFASPVTLSAATAYTVGAKISGVSQVNLYRNGTLANWARMIRTTTTQAPAAGDKLYVMGEHTGQGTGNSFTVTMNETGTTDYGTGSTSQTSLGICKRGTLTFGVATSTNYNLRLSGLLHVYSGGTLNIGTVANPIPSTSSAKLEFDCAAAGDFGLIKCIGGAIVMQGNALSYDRAYLNGDVSAGASSLTTDVSTGWKNGDTIIIGSTTRTYSQWERKTLNGDASGTTVNITGTLSYAHNGSGLRVGEIIHLDRNIKVTVVSGKEAYNAYVIIYPEQDTDGTVDIDWVEFYELGNIASGNKYGLFIGGSTNNISSQANVNIQNCSFHDVYAAFNASYFDNLTFSNCVVHAGSGAITGYAAGPVYFGGVPPTTNWTVSNLMVVGVSGSGSSTGAVVIANIAGSISNITVSSCQTAGVILSTNYYGQNINNITIHSCGSFGMEFYSNFNTKMTLSNFTIWYCNSYGISSAAGGNVSGVTFDNIVIYGCTGGINLTNVNNIKFVGGSLHSMSDATAAYGISLGYSFRDVIFSGMNIGGAASGKTDFVTRGINVGVGVHNSHIVFHNCTWGAITRIAADAPTYADPADKVRYIAFSKDGGVEGDDWVASQWAYLYHDASNGIDGSDCLRIEPSGNTYFFDTSLLLDIAPMFQCPAQDGVSRTVYIQAKDNASFDAANVDISLWFNGTKVVDWTAIESTLTTTYTEYSLNYTPTEDGVLELAIRCDGDAGAIYLDGFRWT